MRNASFLLLHLSSLPVAQYCSGPMAPPPSAAKKQRMAAGNFQGTWGEGRGEENVSQCGAEAVRLKRELNTVLPGLFPPLLILVVMGKEFILTRSNFTHT